ncbi:MAG: hypothetical protein JW838_02670 [Spirochaetes bacterium]|nr:hypothetical protein [Spirochaetota bacterium]
MKPTTTRVILLCALALLPSMKGVPSGKCRAIEVNHGGRERGALLYVPARPLAGNVPLLLVLHGGGGKGRGMISLTRGRFNELAERDGFLVAYPDGIGRHWNDFRDDPIDYAHRNNIDDVGFIRALIDAIAARHPVDGKRVFATGISNGGFMCYRLACELGDRIRGVAVVTANHPEGAKERCRPARPVSVMILNGTEDPLVPYHGGHVTVLKRKRGAIVSTDETVAFWAGANACSAAPRREALPDADPGDGTRIERITYRDCGEGTSVILYRIIGGGHTWPGGKPYLSERIVGRVSRDIAACDVIWKFFTSME